MQISKVNIIEVLNSRGVPTAQATLFTDNNKIHAMASSPSGASKGKMESPDIYDVKDRYHGKGIKDLCDKYSKIVNDKIHGLDFNNQMSFDSFLLYLNLPNSIRVALSFCFTKLHSMYLGIEPYFYFGGHFVHHMPTPMANVINGGMHAKNNLAIQEFMVVPNGNISFAEKTRIISECFYNIKNVAIKNNYHVGVGDEGGIAPEIENTKEALELIMNACKNFDISISLDCAANSYFKDGKYNIDNMQLDTQEMVDYFVDIVDKYPILSIEDPVDESNPDAWMQIMQAIGNKVIIVGDDILVTNASKICEHKNIVHGAIIKPNQSGDITSTMRAVEACNANNIATIVSHRSGDTEDTLISDLAVGIKSKFVKIGNVCRSERTAKYNRLITIESLYS